MKFSINWLNSFIDYKLQPAALAARLTDVGLEVEALDGDLIELAIPPNRADCLGIIGIAREVAAISDVSFTIPEVQTVQPTILDRIDVKIENPQACPVYLSRIIRNTNNTLATPDWMRDRLAHADIKSISAIVDITNYVLLETGQPLHAFDLAHIAAQKLIVRNSKQGEKLVLLDETEIILDAETLVIADAKQPLALAGIKGGLSSGISNYTKDIVLECAYFEPVNIRLAARRYGIQSDGAYRFERGIDPYMQTRVMERVTELVLQIVGGQAGPIVESVHSKYLPKPLEILLRHSRVTRILGKELSIDTITNILTSLGMLLKFNEPKYEWLVTAPSFRTDISREIDLIEEILRIYGYSKIPAQLPSGELVFAAQQENLVPDEKILDCLINRGYNEAITYSFIESGLAKQFYPAVEHCKELQNPISADLSMMRPTLLPGLVSIVQRNQNRQQERVRVCEIGLRFAEYDGNIEQIKTIAGVCTGSNFPENWADSKRESDFFDVKSDVVALFRLAHNDKHLEFRPSTDIAMHPGQCVEVFLGTARVGKMGMLHPALQQSLAINTPVFMFELDMVAVVNGIKPKFVAYSKYPAVRRDLALVVEQQLAVANLLKTIQNNVSGLLTEITIFDVYAGKGIEPTKKSVGLGITLQDPDKTLTDLEVNTVFEKLIRQLEIEHGATLR